MEDDHGLEDSDVDNQADSLEDLEDVVDTSRNPTVRQRRKGRRLKILQLDDDVMAELGKIPGDENTRGACNLKPRNSSAKALCTPGESDQQDQDNDDSSGTHSDATGSRSVEEGYGNEEDELEAFFATVHSTYDSKQLKKKKKNKKKNQQHSEKATAGARKPPPDDSQVHATERDGPFSDGEDVPYDNEDTAAATQRLLREEARFEGLGKGFQPEIQPLNALLSKLAARRAAFNPAGPQAVSTTGRTGEGAPAVSVDAIDDLLNNIQAPRCIDDELVIHDGSDENETGAEVIEQETSQRSEGQRDREMDADQSAKQQKEEEDRVARREKRAERERSRKNAFDLLLRNRIGGVPNPSAKFIHKDQPGSTSIATAPVSVENVTTVDPATNIRDPPASGSAEEAFAGQQQSLHTQSDGQHQEVNVAPRMLFNNPGVENIGLKLTLGSQTVDDTQPQEERRGDFRRQTQDNAEAPSSPRASPTHATSFAEHHNGIHAHSMRAGREEDPGPSIQQHGTLRSTARGRQEARGSDRAHDASDATLHDVSLHVACSSSEPQSKEVAVSVHKATQRSRLSSMSALPHVDQGKGSDACPSHHDDSASASLDAATRQGDGAAALSCHTCANECQQLDSRAVSVMKLGTGAEAAALHTQAHLAGFVDEGSDVRRVGAVGSNQVASDCVGKEQANGMNSAIPTSMDAGACDDDDVKQDDHSRWASQATCKGSPTASDITPDTSHRAEAENEPCTKNDEDMPCKDNADDDAEGDADCDARAAREDGDDALEDSDDEDGDEGEVGSGDDDEAVSGDDEDGVDSDDEEEEANAAVGPAAVKSAYAELLRTQRMREQGTQGATKRKLRARDYYDMEAEQSEDESVSDDEEDGDEYDEYEGMSQTEVEDMLRELEEKGVNQQELANAHAAWADAQDAAAIKKLKRAVKRGFDRGRKRLGGPGGDDDDEEGLEDARARRRARLADAEVEYEGIDADALVRQHLKRSFASDYGVAERQGRRAIDCGTDDCSRRASEREAYQMALASKEVCLPDIDDDEPDASVTGSLWGALFDGTAVSAPQGGANASTPALHAEDLHTSTFNFCDAPTFACDVSLPSLGAPSLLGRGAKRPGMNVRAASTVVSTSFVFNSDISQSGSLQRTSNAAGLSVSDVGTAGNDAGAVSRQELSGAVQHRQVGQKQSAKSRLAQNIAVKSSVLTAVASGIGAGSKANDSIHMNQHLASAVAIKKL